MLILKFIAWDNSEQVFACCRYEVDVCFDGEKRVRVYQGVPVAMTCVATIMIVPMYGSPETTAHYRRLFVMNDQGKTIDSYSADTRL